MTAAIRTVTLPLGSPRRLMRALTLRALAPLSLTFVLRLTLIVSDLKAVPRAADRDRQLATAQARAAATGREQLGAEDRAGRVVDRGRDGRDGGGRQRRRGDRLGRRGGSGGRRRGRRGGRLPARHGRPREADGQPRALERVVARARWQRGDEAERPLSAAGSAPTPSTGMSASLPVHSGTGALSCVTSMTSSCSREDSSAPPGPGTSARSAVRATASAPGSEPVLAIWTVPLVS